MIVNDTPVERVTLPSGLHLYVKREDLCSPYPGPMFSKMRGVVAHIRSRPEPVIGVLDTLHSKAGWCVSYVCAQLGKQAVNYWPRYNADPREGLPRQQQKEAAGLGAKMVAIKAGRSAILYHTAKKHLRETFGADNCYLMPNALKLPESITENAAEATRTALAVASGASSPVLPDAGTLVISISSGTVAAGVVQGLKAAGMLDAYSLVCHMGYSRSIDACRLYMEKASGVDLSRARFVDEGYGYADSVNWNGLTQPEFPCNPYYDGKLFAWLQKPGGADSLDPDLPILFWNIGA